MQEIIKIEINKEICFTEEWREGFVEYNGEKHYFWFIDPQGTDPKGVKYACEVRWWFREVPKEIRAMSSEIINSYLNVTKNDTRKN